MPLPVWQQRYDPLGSHLLSTLAAALPLVTLLAMLASRRIRAHYAAVAGLAMALAVAITIVGMPARQAFAAAGFGAAYGLFPIGWIILNVIFLYGLVEDRGLLAALRLSIMRVTTDARLQLLLVAFCFGAFFEGAAGFGTPVAVTGAMLIGLGFPPLEASGLSLIANTAPVAFGALGTPIIALQGVTGLDLHALSAMVGRQLPVFSVIVPFWLIAAHSGFRGVREVWPALLVAGVSFAIPQFLVSNYHGPWLVDVIAAMVSIAILTGFLRVWGPRGGMRSNHDDPALDAVGPATETRNPWFPWIILSVVVFVWGLPQTKSFLNRISSPAIPIPGLDKLVERVQPVVAKPVAEAAVFSLNWLSATGTAIFITAIVCGALLKYSPREMYRAYGRALMTVRHSLITIAAMLALGYTTRYSGEDAILGLAFAGSATFYPFFGTLLG